MEKTMTEMQKEVDDWAQQFKKPYFSPLSMLATMTEELGEVSRVVNHMYGDKKKKEGESLKQLEEELGDLLFTLICMANDQGISLSDAHSKKMEKVYKRDNNRFQKK
ncbi:MAG: nucleotide pyrophosphohydrolase [Bacilli bacterium]|nr:nucleotide pyrophosphohydrolase [Bacilli bacterium]